MKVYQASLLPLLCAVIWGSPLSQSAEAPASSRAQASDFDALYKTVKAKHDAVTGDLHIDMKEWMPFAIKIQRETDFSGFSSEQLIRLFNLQLFWDLPGPDDDQSRQAIVAMVGTRSVQNPYDALLKTLLAPQDSKLISDPEAMGKLYDRIATDQALKELFGHGYGDTVLSALAYYLPKKVVASRPENTRRVTAAIPKKWPADWAMLGESLMGAAFTESAVGHSKRESVRAAAVAAIDLYLKEKPTGNTAEFLKGSRFRLTDAATKLLGTVPRSLTFKWCSDPKITKLSDLKGRVVVLDFWATWCHYCLVSAPEIAALQKEFSNYKVTVLGVTSLQGYIQNLESGQIDTAKNPQLEYSLTKKVMAKHGMTWPTVFTKEPVCNPEFGIGALPFTVILDPDGRVRFLNLHPANDHAKIRQYVIDLLNEFNLDHP